jgi:hypothetical protein
VVSHDGPKAVVVIVDGDVDIAVVPMAGLYQPDLDVVDALARLQLVVRRQGWAVCLRHPCEELTALLELAGLSGVVGTED